MELVDALAFATANRRGVLVTQKRDGRPQLSNVTHAVGADGVVRVSITADRAKYANLARDPRASLHVSRDDFWAYVVLEGDVELSAVAAAPDDATVDELVELYRSIAGEHSDWDDYRRAMVADRRVVVRLHPSHAYGMLGG
jgi:PPOX class probable F420-dependent enzyme